LTAAGTVSVGGGAINSVSVNENIVETNGEIKYETVPVKTIL
jgi:hypothetical protein